MPAMCWICPEIPVNRGTAGAHFPVEFAGKGEEQVESFPAAHSVTAGNHDVRALEVVLRGLHVAVDDLNHVVHVGDEFRHVLHHHFALPGGVEHLLLHDAAAHGGHLWTVVGIHDGGDDVAAERGPDLVEEVFVVLSGLRVVIVANLELGAVGGESAGEGTGHARPEVAADDGGAHEADLRFLPLEEIHEDVGMGSRRVGEEPRRVKDEQLVRSVGEYLVFDLPGDAGAGDHRMKLHAQPVGELAALGEEFLGYFGNLGAFCFAIYKYVVHGSIRLSFRPAIP